MKIIFSKKISASRVDETTIKEYASDVTIRDIRDDNFASFSVDISVWNCTLHPPTDITNWLFEEFPEKLGPKSKTLYDAGCFPSAIWQVLPRGDAPSTQSVTEDRQYHQQCKNSGIEESTTSSNRVQLVDQPSGMKPSEVLHYVTQRFEDDEDDSEAARVVRRQKRQERRVKEKARHAKLEERIKNLGAIKSGTSEQVRKMLLKSRCTGVKSLRMEDRVYLQVALMKGETVSEDFQYFSRQDTVARLVQSMSGDARPPQEAELLISSSDQTYRRLPLTLRLYEAIEKGWLKESDTIVIRFFTPPEQEPTTSIVEEDDTEPEDTPMTEVVEQEQERPIVVHQQEEPSSEATAALLPKELTNRLNSAIAEIDKKLKPKKKSSSAQRVRQMMMKSKAKGDAKRTPTMENRFFVELLVVEGHSANSSFVFVAKGDSLERLLKEHVKAECSAYAFNKDGTGFVKLSTEATLEVLEASNVLSCFARLVVDVSKL